MAKVQATKEYKAIEKEMRKVRLKLLALLKANGPKVLIDVWCREYTILEEKRQEMLFWGVKK